MVKSEGGQRESDGVVVPLIAGRNPAGGKGPDFGHAREAGTGEGMAGTARSIHPGGIPPVDKVRRLQRKLWAAAKQSEDRRSDIRDFFGSIDHERLLGMVEARVSDRRVIKLVRLWLQAGVMEDGELRASVAGTPQGGVISPLLANIYLHAFDQAVAAAGGGELVRYADDGVLLCRTRAQAEAALALVEQVLDGLGLRLHPGKTRIVDLDQGREGFDFLGWHFRARMSGRLWEQKRIIRYYLHRWPSTRAMKAIRTKIKDRTGRNRVGVRDIRVLIPELTPILRGWGGYFRTPTASSIRSTTTSVRGCDPCSSRSAGAICTPESSISGHAIGSISRACIA